ncbi:choice-of-anchor Q domain-containing protein [Luteimonas salinilitoris]|uniref:Choice-of-anchor Q domain-containing protein n=1 Tax=Luteimonas salinilitoris TaxID=3237697 RepID=A0ABV4HVU7_9GAMM
MFFLYFNTASVASAIGIFGDESTKSIANSTIAFNHQVDPIGATCSGVVQADGVLHLESTIVASSTCKNDPPYDDTPYDIGGSPDVDSVMGANNLVMTSWLPLPADTITTDPRRGRLAANGGRTRTHALRDSSPAIDTGNNAAGLQYDQRGAGYPRVKGVQADIGAYER